MRKSAPKARLRPAIRNVLPAQAGLFGVREADALTERVLEELNAFWPNSRGHDHVLSWLKPDLHAVLERYCLDRTNYEALDWREVQEATTPLIEAAKRLDALLFTTPPEVRVALVGQQVSSTTYARFGRNGYTTEKLRHELHELVLRGIAVTSAAPHEKPEFAKQFYAKSGPREKVHVARAAIALARIWARLTSSEPMKTFTWVQADDSFVEPYPKFVFLVMHTADPDNIQPGSISSALAKIKGKLLKN